MLFKNIATYVGPNPCPWCHGKEGLEKYQGFCSLNCRILFSAYSRDYTPSKEALAMAKELERLRDAYIKHRAMMQLCNGGVTDIPC